ncbi:MAG: hypothetical protein ACRCXZ_00075 [Patescibacteria group bacterium]
MIRPTNYSGFTTVPRINASVGKPNYRPPSSYRPGVAYVAPKVSPINTKAIKTRAVAPVKTTPSNQNPAIRPNSGVQNPAIRTNPTSNPPVKTQPSNSGSSNFKPSTSGSGSNPAIRTNSSTISSPAAKNGGVVTTPSTTKTNSSTRR